MKVLVRKKYKRNKIQKKRVLIKLTRKNVAKATLEIGLKFSKWSEQNETTKDVLGIRNDRIM